MKVYIIIGKAQNSEDGFEVIDVYKSESEAKLNCEILNNYSTIEYNEKRYNSKYWYIYTIIEKKVK